MTSQMSMLPTTNNAPKCVECKFNFASVNELRDDNPNDLFWTLCDDCFYDQERDEEAEKEEDDECFQEGIITYRHYRKHLIKQHAIGSNNIIRRWLKYSNANKLEWATKPIVEYSDEENDCKSLKIYHKYEEETEE